MTDGVLSVLDVFDRVKRTFGDESGVQVTEADILRWINDAQREAVMQNEGLLQTTGTLDAVTGQGDYSLPTNCFTLQHIYYKDSVSAAYYKLKWYPLAQFSELLDGWLNSESKGFPTYYTSQTAGSGSVASQISIFPLPENNIEDALKLVYSRYASNVLNSSDTIDLPPFLHSFVVNFCLMQAYEMDENWEAAQIKATQIQGDLDFNSTRHLWFGKEAYPSVVTRYEDYE